MAREIEAGCESSRVILPLLTPRWKLSEWTRYETYGAEAVLPVVAEGEWSDVVTPPLMATQTRAIRLADRSDADWQGLYDAIRRVLATAAPVKGERIAHLRYLSNPYFVGREASLNEIHEKLFTNPTTVLTQGHVAAVTALGGVGKTTLAREYAEKFWRCYLQMFWVDCRRNIESEFAAIHDLLHPEDRGKKIEDAIKADAARKELQQHGRPATLLIVDNAEDEESVAPWIPKTGNCHTIVTSRFAHWSPGIEVCPVWELEPAPARELLLRRAGRTESSGEAADCDALAKKLEYLPLALEQAAAYVEQQPGFRFADYLHLITQHENEWELLSRKEGTEHQGTTEYPEPVFLTWRTTLEKLPAGARAVLRLCSFLAPAPIPAEMVIQGAAIVAKEGGIEKAGEVQARDWLSALARYSMIRFAEDGAFSIHSLVQAVERHQVPEERQREKNQQAVELLMSWAPVPAFDFKNWAAWKVARPHAQRLWESMPADAATERHARLELEFGDFLSAQGEYAAAEPLLVQAVQLYARVQGEERPDTLAAVTSLAALFANQGRYGEAEPLYQRALRAQERVLGAEHPDTLTSVNNLALLYKRQGRYGEAEPLYQRALQARQRVLGAEHPDTLASVNNLAGLYDAQGRYGEAEPLYQRALWALERVLGAEHPNTLGSVNNLALLYKRQGRYGEAEPLYQRAVEGIRRVLGEAHPHAKIVAANYEAFLKQRRPTAFQRVLRFFAGRG